ncbi:MAG: metallophosphoesterase [Bacteroidales bacterium]|nr:metallophosphoesterase [Bacteroidales bacterium]
MLVYLIIVSLILGIVIAVLPHVLWLLAWMVGKCSHCTIPYAPFGWTALVLVMIVWAILAWGCFVGRWRLQTTRMEFVHPDIPSFFDGYKIVHISDLHLSTFDDNQKQLKRFVDSINDLEPDLICFTGDLVTLGRSEAEPYTTTLQELKALDGVVSVFGNHDFLIYNRKLTDNMIRQKEVKELDRYEREQLGWRLLRNENMVIERSGERLTFIGVDNTVGKGQGFSTIDRGDLPKAMSGTGGFRILLTHDPSHWRAEVLSDTDIPLTLSGHTHSAQVRLFGWTPASWVFKEAWGRYDEGDQSLNVNAGLGCTLPVRINCPAEITLITLRKHR